MFGAPTLPTTGNLRLSRITYAGDANDVEMRRQSDATNSEPTFFPKAGDRTRTGDVQLGKLAFYQLNYARSMDTTYRADEFAKGLVFPTNATRASPRYLGRHTRGCARGSARLSLR